jgi:hypothetical protein
MMSVMAIVTLLAGFTVPAVKGITGATSLTSGAAKVAGMLDLARSQAISKHTIVRFLVATNWPDTGAEGSLRRVSLWSWDADSGQYLPLTPWEELPVGTILEQGIPDYVRTASYAQNDVATVRGNCVLSQEMAGEAGYTADSNIGPISTRYIEFLPSGSARIPGSTDRQAIFVTTQGYADPTGQIVHTTQSGGHAANWAQVNVDTLTGRTHLYRP